MNNADLLNPNSPTAPGSRVNPLPTFRSINEHGEVVESTKPFPTVTMQESKYYFHVTPHASMYRTDGVRLPFINHICETNLKHSQDYLDLEIADGNPYVKHATIEQIRAYKFSRDPTGTVTDEVKKVLEPQLREQLEKEILEKLAQEMQTDGDKLAGTNTGDRAAAIERLRAGKNTVLMTSQPPPLQGIVGSDKLAGAAAGSASGVIEQ